MFLIIPYHRSISGILSTTHAPLSFYLSFFLIQLFCPCATSRVFFCFPLTPVLLFLDSSISVSFLSSRRQGRRRFSVHLFSTRSGSGSGSDPGFGYLARLLLYKPAESAITLIQGSSLLVLRLSSRRCFVTLVLHYRDRHYHEFFTGFRRCFTRVNGGGPLLIAE